MIDVKLCTQFEEFMERDTRRSDEKPEVKIYYGTCTLCEWETDTYAEEDEVPTECVECGADVKVEGDYV